MAQRKGIKWYANVQRWRDVQTGLFTTYVKPAKSRKKKKRKKLIKPPRKRLIIKKRGKLSTPLQLWEQIEELEAKLVELKDKAAKLPPEPRTLTPELDAEKEAVLRAMRIEMSKFESNLSEYNPITDYAENADGTVDMEIILWNVGNTWDSLTELRINAANAIDVIDYGWISTGVMIPPTPGEDIRKFYEQYTRLLGYGTAFANVQEMRVTEGIFEGRDNIPFNFMNLGQVISEMRKAGKQIPVALYIRVAWNPEYKKPRRW